MYTKYYLLVIYHVLNFVMINKGCLVSQTMPGFLSFVDLDEKILFVYWKFSGMYCRELFDMGSRAAAAGAVNCSPTNHF